MKRFLSILLTFCCALTLPSCKKDSADSPEDSDSTTSAQTTALKKPSSPPLTDAQRMLSVGKDGLLYNKKGDEVVLCGINLGGWLLQETWMCPVVGSECNLDSIHLLESRGFTDQQIATLFQTYADNYITRRDVQNIAALGMNCIRLPFWYRNFMDDDLQFYTENPDDNPGFILLDRLIGWAREENLYVILDLHGAPGGQSTNHCCGTLNKNELYTVEANLAATERLWTAIASRYKDSGTVAAYDLLNEPMNNDTALPNGWAAGSETALSYTHMAYDRLYKAVRAVDPAHMISVEGIWSGSCLPDPALYGWENMLYQMHLYDSDKIMIAYRVSELLQLRKDYKVAIYVGEFNNGDQQYTYALDLYRKNKISRTAWTYKVSYGNLGNWSLYRSDIPAADLANDSYQEILDKWSDPLRTTSKGWSVNTTLRTWLKKHF